MILTVPGGKLSSAQMKAIAKVAADHGRDLADLTTARGIRLHGIPADLSSELLSRLSEAGLAPQDPAFVRESEEQAGQQPDPIGVLEQQEAGFFTIGVPVLTGKLSIGQMRKAADVAERYADGKLQLTSRQNLLFLNVPKERVLQMLEGLELVDLRVAASVYRRGLTACAEGVEERARGLLDYLESRVPLKEPLGIHFSAGGCNCEQVLGAEIGLRATQVQGEDRMIDAYHLAVDGRPVPGLPDIPAGMVKYRLENLLVRWKRNRASGEPLREFCRRTGDEELARLLSEEAAHPAA